MAHDVDNLLASYNGGAPPQCVDGQTRCVGYDLEKCLAGNWFLWETNNVEICGYVPPEPPPPEDGIWEWIKKNALYLGAGGAAVAGVILLATPKKPK